MDIVFLVEGKINKSDVEKRVIYNGQSAKKAFDVLHTWAVEADITIKIYENGLLVDTISKAQVVA